MGHNDHINHDLPEVILDLFSAGHLKPRNPAYGVKQQAFMSGYDTLSGEQKALTIPFWSPHYGFALVSFEQLEFGTRPTHSLTSMSWGSRWRALVLFRGQGVGGRVVGSEVEITLLNANSWPCLTSRATGRKRVSFFAAIRWRGHRSPSGAENFCSEPIVTEGAQREYVCSRESAKLCDRRCRSCRDFGSHLFSAATDTGQSLAKKGRQ